MQTGNMISQGGGSAGPVNRLHADVSSGGLLSAKNVTVFGDLIVHGAVRTPTVDLEERLKTLEEQVLMLWHAPGMPGYMEAQASWTATLEQPGAPNAMNASN